MEADLNHYRFEAPILFTSPGDDPRLEFDMDGEPVGSGNMGIEVDGRIVQKRKFGPGRVRLDVGLEGRGILKGDLVYWFSGGPRVLESVKPVAAAISLCFFLFVEFTGHLCNSLVRRRCQSSPAKEEYALA